MIRNILIMDLETDSLEVDKARMRFFGAYSYLDEEFYLLPYTDIDKIKTLIARHKVLVGFNNKAFDNPILANNGFDLKYKIIIDLYEMSAPKGKGNYGLNNKNKLNQMGVDVKRYRLKDIIEALKLDEINKGEIDYTLFQKDSWNNEELKQIKIYLKQDLILTKKLFLWYEEQFEPIKPFLSKDSQQKFKHLTSSLASLSYEIICNLAGLKLEWCENKPKTKSFPGGHHINPRWDKVKGNIVNIDFTSAYPHALMMGNLYSHAQEGWNGKEYFKLQGTYNTKEQGKIEQALNKVFIERLKAKKEKDKIKSLAYKIVINSLYGLTANYKFKTLYNPITASDCTSIVRTWLKKLAKKLEENDFQVLYGFTDNLIIKIPQESCEEDLMMVVDDFIKEVKLNMPFPLETFKMDLETRMKFIWFVAKNCYLYVTDKNEVKYKSTLLNTNTPKIIMQVFEDYIKPKIIKELDVVFALKELEEQIKIKLNEDISLSCEEYNVSGLDNYKVKTSLHYQISEKYGAGKHLLIPNLKGVGVGKATTTKNKIGVRYCSVKEFEQNKLTSNDIDISQLIKHLKEFITI